MSLSVVEYTARTLIDAQLCNLAQVGAFSVIVKYSRTFVWSSSAVVLQLWELLRDGLSLRSRADPGQLRRISPQSSLKLILLHSSSYYVVFYSAHKYRTKATNQLTHFLPFMYYPAKYSMNVTYYVSIMSSFFCRISSEQSSVMFSVLSGSPPHAAMISNRQS